MSLGRLILWVLFLGSGPVCLCLVWFLFLFAAFCDETQVSLGDLRIVVCWWFCVFCCLCGLICLLIWTNCVHCTTFFSLLLSRSFYRSHVLTTFLGPALGAMMKQVCWHSMRSKAYRGLPEARGQSEAHGDSNLYNTIVGVP